MAVSFFISVDMTLRVTNVLCLRRCSKSKILKSESQDEQTLQNSYRQKSKIAFTEMYIQPTLIDFLRWHREPAGQLDNLLSLSNLLSQPNPLTSCICLGIQQLRGKLVTLFLWRHSLALVPL